MITKEDLLAQGFNEWDGIGKRDRGNPIFGISISGGLGINLAVSLVLKKCFTFEADRDTAFPYPIEAIIRERFIFPESMDNLEHIYYSLTGKIFK